MNSTTTGKRSILFTNLFETARTGSELHILALAKAFKEKNWEVDVFTLAKGLPLQQDFLENGINLFDYTEISKLQKHYDVLFAQHRLVSERVWEEGISFKTIVLSSLSPFNPHEFLPSFSSEASILLTNSEETKAARLKDVADRNSENMPPGLAKGLETMVFLNYAQDTEISHGLHKKRKETKAPQSIAVISNHIPPELSEAQVLFEKAGVQLSFFGTETTAIDPSPETLDSYDLVVSIGRTAQTCFATKTPFYCYDLFGGPGYIDKKSFQEAAEFNFSGRNKPLKRSAQELYDDIKEGYEANLSNLDFLWEKVKTSFSFKKQFEAFYEMLLEQVKKAEESEGNQKKNISEVSRDASTSSRSHVAPHQLHAGCESPHLTSSHAERLARLDEEIGMFLGAFLPSMGNLQLFWADKIGGKDGDVDFRRAIAKEENSLFLSYRYNTEITLHPSHFLPTNATLIRLDPDIHAAICRVSATLRPLNRFDQRNGEDLFITSDPIYLTSRTEATSELSFIGRIFSSQEMAKYLDESATAIDQNQGNYQRSLDALIYENEHSILRKAQRKLTRIWWKLRNQPF